MFDPKSRIYQTLYWVGGSNARVAVLVPDEKRNILWIETSPSARKMGLRILPETPWCLGVRRRTLSPHSGNLLQSDWKIPRKTEDAEDEIAPHWMRNLQAALELERRFLDLEVLLIDIADGRGDLTDSINTARAIAEFLNTSVGDRTEDPELRVDLEAMGYGHPMTLFRRRMKGRRDILDALEEIGDGREH